MEILARLLERCDASEPQFLLLIARVFQSQVLRASAEPCGEGWIDGFPWSASSWVLALVHSGTGVMEQKDNKEEEEDERE